MVRISLTLALAAILAGCGASEDAAVAVGSRDEAQAVTACGLLTPEEVAAVIGIPVTNAVEQSHGMFGNCRYETGNRQQTVGLMHFSGLTPKSAAQLAEEVRADLEREGMPDQELQIEPGVGAPAVYYPAPDGGLHTLVIQSGEHKIILTAASHDTVTALAKRAVAALPGSG